MKKQLFFIFFCMNIVFYAFSMQPDSLNRFNEKPPKGLIFKFGGYASGNNSHTSFNSFELSPAVEIALSEKLTLNFGALSQESLTSYSNDAMVHLDVRYYFKPLYGLKTSNGFSGTYISPTFYKFITERAGNELPFSAESPDVNRPYLMNYGAGVKLGQQYQGMIDFGIFLGIENAKPYLGSKNGESRFSGRKTIYPILSSYGKLAIPIGNKEFRTLLKANLNQKIAKTSIVKFGLNDAFCFSKKGVYFRPQIAYEKALGKTGLALNAKGEGIIFRAKYFDAEKVNIDQNTYTFTFSEKAYLHQYIEFVFKPQLRYYFETANLRKNGSNLEGLYLHTAAELRTGTEEIKRNIWYYDKFSEASFGGGLGAQKMIMGNILLDAHVGVFRNNKTSKNFFGGGIDLYWVK
jgi:hypothetical protein